MVIISMQARGSGLSRATPLYYDLPDPSGLRILIRSSYCLYTPSKHAI